MTIHSSSGANPSPLSSPHSNGSNNNGNGFQFHGTPPISPIPVSRSDAHPFPTTFIQADTASFKQVVQMLTGSSESPKNAAKPPSSPPQQNSLPSKNFSIPPIKSNNPKKQSFKLYERRNSNLKHNLMINTIGPSGAGPNFSLRKLPEIMSPSILDFPNLTLSPVTPLNEDNFSKLSSPSLGNSSEEEKAIAEKGFFLHPSPLSTPRGSEPQLLSLFPVTSPKVAGASS